MRESLAGRLKEAPPREPTAAELEFRAVVKERIKDLVHRRHYTHGLNAIWAQIKGGQCGEAQRLAALRVHEPGRGALPGSDGIAEGHGPGRPPLHGTDPG
jgi:hypothetical protein